MKIKITESQYRIISEAKSKKDIIINKLGFKPELAEIFESVGKKLAVWLANKYLKYFYEKYKNMAEPNVSNETILNVAKDRINSDLNPRRVREILTSIMDYINVGLNQDKSSLNDLSILEIISRSTVWHNELKVGNGDINYIEENPIMLDFRDENGIGYYWADLETNYSKEECNRMGHCGTSNYGDLYSLRSYKQIPNTNYTINKSHLTAAVGPNGILYQLKGRKNSKPKEEYFKYILPLFNLEVDYGDLMAGSDINYFILGFGSEYDSDNDFKITDLSNDMILKLYKERPDLFKSLALQLKLYELNLIEKPKTEIIYQFNSKYLNDYIKTEYYDRVLEKIVDGEYEPYFYDCYFENSLYYINNENELKIKEILKKYAESDGKVFNENQDIEELIKQYDYDSEIKQALENSECSALDASYVNNFYKSIMSTLSEYGTVFEYDGTGKIEVGINILNLGLDVNEIDDIMETYEVDSLYDIINTIFDEKLIDKPELDLINTSMLEIDENYFNDELRERLSYL